MYYTTYEKQLINAYNKSELYQIATVNIAITLVDVYRQYKRGVTVKQVISVLNKELANPQWNYESIQLALNETEPKGRRHDG